MEQSHHTRPIIITGAAGFVGANLARRLRSHGRDMHAIVKPSTDTRRLDGLGITIHEMDLTDRDALARLVQRILPDGLFHLAAANMWSGMSPDPEMLVRTNILGMVNLVDAMDGIDYRFFINTGTFLEYGAPLSALQEDSPCAPNELYSITKLAATLYGRMAGKERQKPIVTFRMFTPYGPFVQPGRLMHEAIAHALSNEPLSLTDPRVTRDFIFIDDVITLFEEAMEKAPALRGEIFNCGTGTATSLEKLASLVLAATGSQSEIRWGAYRDVSYDSDRWAADMTKTFSHFRWRPTHTMQDGIAKTVEWFRMARP